MVLSRVLRKLFSPIVSKRLGNTTLLKPLHPLKALAPISLSPVKYSSSSNDVIAVLPLNTSPKLVTAAVSASLSSPSSLVSQLATHKAFTLASAKAMAGDGVVSTISLNSFQTSAVS